MESLQLNLYVLTFLLCEEHLLDTDSFFFLMFYFSLFTPNFNQIRVPGQNALFFKKKKSVLTIKTFLF